MNAPEFAKAMGYLMAATGARFDEDVVEAWRQLLSDIPDDVLKLAFGRAARECKAFPSVALIREYAAEMQHGLTPSHGEAFGKVMEAVRLYGACVGCQPACDACREVKAKEHMGDLAWRVVKSLGGWQGICDSNPGERRNLMAHFRKVYEDIAARETELQRLPERLRPRLNGQSVEGSEPNPAPKAIAPPAASPKALVVFREPSEGEKPEISDEELERRRQQQIKAAETLINRRTT